MVFFYEIFGALIIWKGTKKLYFVNSHKNIKKGMNFDESAVIQ